jgi:glycolate oxidase FAD binding subunit
MAHPLEDLRRACDGRVTEASPTDAVLGMLPRWVAGPATTEEVAGVMRAAATHELAVVVRGAGTKLGWGQAPKHVDLILDTTRLDSVVEHAAGDLIVVTGAGRRLEDLQRDLGREGQRLGVDPTRRGTVGGAVATGSTGPLRLHHGPVRDLVIGMTMVRADGVVAHSGGKVVKNVAGYDLGKLLTGSFGTLGVITEVAFRLHPQPAARTWVDVRASGPDGIHQAVQAIVHSQLMPAAVELDLRPRNAAATLSVLLEGHPEGLPERAHEVGELIGHDAVASEEAPEWWGCEPGEAGDALLKVTYEIGSLPALLTALAQAEGATGCALSGRLSVAVGVGLVAVGGPHDGAGTDADRLVRFVAALREAAVGFGGSVVLLEAPRAAKERIDPWGPVRGLELMRAVKQQFDPGRRLAPGRFVGGI